MTGLVGWLVTMVFVILAYIRLAVILCYFVFLGAIATLALTKIVSLLILKLKPRFGSRAAEMEQIVISTPTNESSGLMTNQRSQTLKKIY